MEPMEPNERYRFTQKLYEFLREKKNTIELKKLWGSIEGYYYFGENRMELDYRKEIISTLIHECIHHYNPDKCETWVIAEEKKVINNLSIRQIKNIIKEFAKSL
jgi:hypothetical protein